MAQSWAWGSQTADKLVFIHVSFSVFMVWFNLIKDKLFMILKPMWSKKMGA